MARRTPTIGDRYGRLVVQAAGEMTARGRVWECLCDCGGRVAVLSAKLNSGHTQSCGCLRHEVLVARNTKHGHGSARKGVSATYTSWQAMQARCYNPTSPSYRNYGGRGIKVCRRWHLFENFLADMGERPAGMTLERKDSNKAYSPSNCLWADKETQSNNRRDVIIYSYAGRAMSLAQWCRELGLNYHTIYNRIKRSGLSFEQAIS